MPRSFATRREINESIENDVPQGSKNLLNVIPLSVITSAAVVIEIQSLSIVYVPRPNVNIYNT